MNAEILSVGTELLLGGTVNTDARDISLALAELGVNVYWHTVVGDNPARLTECIYRARNRADLIITTGGLGPTCDDLTKQTLARAFDRKLYLNEDALADIREYFAERGRSFTDNNLQQAYLPEGSIMLPNDCGTAPGCIIEDGPVRVVMLPGPPKECYTMFMRSALPYLRQLSDELIVSHSINIFGIGESAVDDMFSGEMNLMKNPSMAPYAKECDCLLQVTAKAKSEAAAEEMLRPVMERVCQRLGEYVYGVDVENLEQGVFAALTARPMTFATAESCTGGEIAKRFTDLPGASRFFIGGLVTYKNDAKTRLLGIDPELIRQKSAVSYEVAQAMAEGVRTRLGADIGIGVTGIAGPLGDGLHEVGTVFVSMAVEGQTYVRELHMGTYRTRSFIRRMAGNHAFDMMRRYLSGLNVEMK